MDSQDAAQLDTEEVAQTPPQDAVQIPPEVAAQVEGQEAQEDAAQASPKALSEADGSQTAPSWQEPSDEGTFQEIGAVCGGSQPPSWSFHPQWTPAMGPPGAYQQGMSSSGMGPQGMPQQGVGPPAMGPPAMGPQGMGPQSMGPQAGMGPQGLGPHGMCPPGMAPAGMCPPGMCPPGMVPHRMGPHGMCPPRMGPSGMGPCMPPPGFMRYSACQPPPMVYRWCCPHPPPGPPPPRRNRKRRREQRAEPEAGETPTTPTTPTSADASGRPYTPRASKITTQNPSTGASDMLVEALRRGPDAALRIARSLFSKRMLTLYGWLYPHGARRDVKHSIDRLWERLPPAEKKFYLAQAEGAFGSRGGRPMVNPQLAALAGLPGPDRAATADAEPCDTPGETEQAVNSLLQLVEDDAARSATTASEGWDGGDPDYDGNPLGLPRLLELARQSGLGNDEFFPGERGSRDSDEYTPHLDSLDEFPAGDGLLSGLISDDYQQTLSAEFPSEDCAAEESLVDGYHGEGYQGDVFRQEEVEYRMEEIHGEAEQGNEYYSEEYQAEEYPYAPDLGVEETLFDEEFAVAHEVVLSADGYEIC